MPEGTEADFHAFPLNDGTLDAPGYACVEDALFIQHTFGRENALFAEVVGMVVGHAHEVEAGFLEQMAITGGCTERVGVRPVTLGTSAAITDGPFEIAYGQICACQDVLGIAKQVSAVICRKHHTGECRPHHDISSHGNGEFLSMYCH